MLNRRLCQALLLGLLLLVLLPAALYAQNTDADAMLARGDEALYQSDLNTAEGLYSSVVDGYADDPSMLARAFARRCNLYLYRFDLDAAEEDCQQAIALAPDLADGYIFLTRVYDWRSNYLFALMTGLHAVALAPEDPVALALTGEVFGDIGLLQRAETYLDRAAALASPQHPEHGVVSRNRAHLHNARGDYDGFEKAMRQAIAWAPAFAPFQEELGQYFGRTGNLPAMLETLRGLLTVYAAVDNIESVARVQHLIAQSLYSFGRFDEALVEYETLLDVERESGDQYGIIGTLTTLSALYQQIEEYDRAIAAMTEAMEIAEGLNVPALIGSAATGLGRIYRRIGDYTRARIFLKVGLDKAEQGADNIGQIGVLNELGALSTEAGDRADAQAYHARALEIAQTIAYPYGEADSHAFLGLALAAAGNYGAAKGHFEQALTIAVAVGNRYLEGQTEQNLGRVHLELGAYAAAEEHLTHALEIAREYSDRPGEAGILGLFGQVYAARGEFDLALDYFDEALTNFRDLGDQAGTGIVLGDVGAVYLAQGQYARAQAAFDQGLESAILLDDLSQQAVLLTNIGTLVAAQGQGTRALALFEQAEAIAREVDNKTAIAATRANAGLTYWQTGQYNAALIAQRDALELVQESGNRAAEGTILMNIGLVYQSLGLSNVAYDYFLRALEIQETIGAAAGRATTLNALAHLHLVIGDRQSAADMFEEALQLSRQLGLQAQTAVAMNNLGLVQAADGEYAAAQQLFTGALTIAQSMGDRRLEATLLANLGELAYDNGDLDVAGDQLQRAQSIEEEIGDWNGLGGTLMALGRLHEATGDIQGAFDAYTRAIEIHESLLNAINVEEFKICFACLSNDVYAHMISLLVREDRPAEAFVYMERARARALLDQLTNGKVDIRRGADKALLDREYELRAQIRAARMQLLELRNQPVRKWDLTTIQATQDDLNVMEATYANLLTDLKLQSPEVAGLVSVDTTSLTEAQQRLDDETTLLVYYIAGDELLASVLTRTSFDLRVLTAPPAEVAAAIADFRAFISLDEPYDPNLQQLQAWLIDPIEDLLVTPKLGIVPHDVLHYLPFAALTDGTTFLGERYDLFTLPAVSLLPQIDHNGEESAPSVLVVGDPDIDAPLAVLPFAAQEASAIADLYQTQPLLHRQATETTIVAQAEGATIIHLAVHGEYNAGNPLFSALHLASDEANDGRLEVHEIYGLDLREQTRLIVLSACETQRGVLSGGDEVVALSRAFFFAGTPSVVATLWNVDDAATARLMQEFHQGLRQGMPKAAALAAAQAAVRQDYPHPFYWAAFVLTGDGGVL